MISSDRIEKRVVLRASLQRVWQAISDAKQFGVWFGIELTGEFVAGSSITGSFIADLDETAIVKQQEKLGLRPTAIRMAEKQFVFCTVERVEPERYFSFRWIPYGIDADADPNAEPTTLVEFFLQEMSEGTLLTIVESGFDSVPAHRRERAFRMNEAGWGAQAENVSRYVDGP